MIITELLYALLLLLSCVKASEWNLTEQVNDMIRDSLERYYSGVVPQIDYTAPTPVPFEVMVNIINFTGIETLNDYGMLSRSMLAERNNFIRYKMSLFSPHTVFEADWFNFLLHQIVFEAFPLEACLRDPQAPDYLALLTLKFVIKEHKAGKDIPEYVYLSILAYLYEIVYGPGSQVPTDFLQFTYFYAEKVQQLLLPHTKARLYAYISEIIFVNNDIIKHLDFLETRPDYQEMVQYYDSRSDNINISSIALRVIFQVSRIREPITNSYQANSILKELNLIGPVASTRVFQYLPISDGNLAKNWQHMPNWFNHLLTGNPKELAKYLLSIDHSNPFDLSVFLELANQENVPIQKAFADIVHMRLPFHRKIDILTKLLKSGVVELNKYNVHLSRLINPMANSEKSPIFELIFRESSTIINIKNYFEHYSKSFFRMSPKDYEMIIDTQLQPENPISLLFLFNMNFFNLCDYITAKHKFNLNVRYHFEGDISNYIFGFLYKEQFKRFAGRTLTMRQILQNVGNLNEFFDLENEPFDENVEAYPVYSVRKALMEGKMELIDRD